MLGLSSSPISSRIHLNYEVFMMTISGLRFTTSQELRYLLQHPLISSFLFLKWHRLSVIFYLNFLLYSLFTASIITHTLLKFHESDHTGLTALFGLFSWIGIVYLMIREVIQLAMSPLLYFRSITNLMEVALIVIKTIVMLTGEFDAGDIKFDSVYTYLIFLLFVFFMTIVLFNLLNGLAVSDTQAIKAQAELNGAIVRTNLLTRYQQVLT
ncbi:transient receptor potential cation channel protein painless-like, partial [Drosophila miranda]|uniref:transient receptor potential cation channel protein painless-like n=1 Tax=Drosophila miranda TaxID=7229 RepID=UPI00143F36A4